MGEHIGLSGKAFTRGIPAATLTWTHRVGATGHSVTIFNDFSISTDCDVAESTGNDGEWLAAKRRNKRWLISVTTKPVGANAAAALAIATDPPMKLDLVTIANHTDTRLNHANWIVDDAPQVSYTPENEATMTLRLKAYWDDDDGSVSTITALT